MAKTTINVTLIGLNRLTASMGMALKTYSKDAITPFTFKLIGQDGDKKAMETARHFEAVDETQTNAQSAIRYADIVVVSLPAGVIEGVYEFFSTALKPGTVVLDLSFGKVSALQLAEKYFPRNPDGTPKAYLVGIQPLVSNAFLYDAGYTVETADPRLLMGSEMVIAPSTHCPEEAVKLAVDLAGILQMRVHFMEPAEYEAMTKITENLPSLLGLALFSSIQSQKGRDLERLINPNFALMLQSLRYLEADDLLTSWLDDPQGTQRHIDSLILVLSKVRDLLAEDSDEAKKYLKDALRHFRQWEARRATGKWEVDSAVDQPPGLLASLLGFGWLQNKKKKNDSLS